MTFTDPDIEPLVPLPVPSTEADDAMATIGELAALVETLVSTRQSGHATHLASWEGAERTVWEESFWFSQADGAVVIDDLQNLCASITGVINAIEEHNVVASYVNR